MDARVTLRAPEPPTRETLAIVIPARNEVASIRDVAVACLRESRTVIVVDDASTDGTAAALHDLPVVVLRSETRLGKGGALLQGFRAAQALGAHAVMTLDGDGQHDPADVTAFLATAGLHPGALLIGARVLERNRAPLVRRAANRIADFWISIAAGQPVHDSQCGHRLYPDELLGAWLPPADGEDGFVFESEVVIEAAWRGTPIVAVPIAARYPAGGRASHFRPVRDIWRITRMVARRIFSPHRPAAADTPGIPEERIR